LRLALAHPAVSFVLTSNKPSRQLSYFPKVCKCSHI
jgi:hypothetical protein